MRFKDKVAIVTGCGRGIGRATILAFAREGAKVVINDLDEEPAREVLREVQAADGQGIICLGSVTDRQAVQRMVDDTVAAYGGIDILVNNAGVLNVAMILKMTEAEWDRVIDTHMKGSFNCMQAVGQVMIERAKPDARSNGKIVNITSTAGLRGTIGQINYGAAKAGLIGMAMSAAREWGRFRINVNTVAFGIVETRMTETLRTDPRFKDNTLSGILLGRFAPPEEMAGSILFMCSSDADFITGHTLNVSGGGHIGF